MNASAVEALEGADLVVFIADTLPGPAERRGRQPASDRRTLNAHPMDEALLGLLPTSARILLVVNKVDKLRNKSLLLPQMAALRELRGFVDIVPACLLVPADVERVLAAVEQVLPEGNPRFDGDTLTDRPLVFFVREYIREQVLLSTAHEVPHAIAVSIDTIEETRGNLRIAATLHVEKEGQKKIMVGRGGSVLRRVGIEARRRIEQLAETRVHLSLFVRTTAGWRSAPRRLTELGYDAPTQPALGRVLLDGPIRTRATGRPP
jgi:GTP-binding protein Era